MFTGLECTPVGGGFVVQHIDEFSPCIVLTLTVPQVVTDQLLGTGLFDVMTPRVDEDEHSIEMHLPFIKQVLLLLDQNTRRQIATSKC